MTKFRRNDHHLMFETNDAKMVELNRRILNALKMKLILFQTKNV